MKKRQSKGSWFSIVVLTERCYGGPEEGGWYYDAQKTVMAKTRFRSERAATRCSERRSAKIRRVRWADPGEAFGVWLDNDPSSGLSVYTTQRDMKSRTFPRPYYE